MKIMKEKYPMGSFKYQKSPGKYIDGYMYRNLEVLADSIVKDMTFLGICFSSTLEVGTGKSVFCTQLGEAWSHIMKKKHGLDIPFTQHNLVFRPQDLIERAFQVPKYSMILVDEWEDAHYWSEMGTNLRKFFRKCRQLNLFIMLIIPNFFQMPMSYAISRSAFCIDVKFGPNFKRGFFDFYSFGKKKDLYVLGKKTHNYRVTRPDFNGVFADGYGIPEAEYRKAKLEDMMKYDREEKKPQTPKQVKREMFKELLEKIPGMTQAQLAKAFGIAESTASRWLNDYNDDNEGTGSPIPLPTSDYTKNLNKEIDYSEVERMNEDEQ